MDIFSRGKRPRTERKTSRKMFHSHISSVAVSFLKISLAYMLRIPRYLYHCYWVRRQENATRREERDGDSMMIISLARRHSTYYKFFYLFAQLSYAALRLEAHKCVVVLLLFLEGISREFYKKTRLKYFRQIHAMLPCTMRSTTKLRRLLHCK